MRRVLVTGARGFIGRNLVSYLESKVGIEVFSYDVDQTEVQLQEWLSCSDVIIHLAGVNRPKFDEDFEVGNTGITLDLCEKLRLLNHFPKIVYSSSIQAALDNPYGLSKRHAETCLLDFTKETGAQVSIYRLKNVFGKWCLPEYNSVTATFCHHIAHDLPISISDPQREIELVYIDDVVEQLYHEIESLEGPSVGYVEDSIDSYCVTLGDLAGRIQCYHEMKSSLKVPDFSDRFNQCLYATYLSYVDTEKRVCDLIKREDNRGSLGEFLKSDHAGQIFVSHTHPGVVRGNHYHHTKTEKFFVVSGEALIRMRAIENDHVDEYYISGKDYRVVDIPPGYTHSIANIASDELITLFWASEVFNPDHPDTFYLDVDVKAVALER